MKIQVQNISVSVSNQKRMSMFMHSTTISEMRNRDIRISGCIAEPEETDCVIASRASITEEEKASDLPIL